MAVALITTIWSPLSQSESYFNPAFLNDGTANVADLSRFEQGHQQAPGTYRVDVWRNDEFIGTLDIPFEAAEEDSPPPAGGLTPCINRAILGECARVPGAGNGGARALYPAQNGHSGQ